jgi:hypothetical protein
VVRGAGVNVLWRNYFGSAHQCNQSLRFTVKSLLLVIEEMLETYLAWGGYELDWTNEEVAVETNRT